MTLLETPPKTSTATGPELLFREARQRRKRRWLVSGIVAAVIIVAVSSIVLLGTTAGQGTSTQGIANAPTPVAGVGALPKQMVIVNLGGKQQTLEVISSSSGHTVRKLTSAVGSFDGTIQATVTRSGIVYFDHAGALGDEPSQQIWRVPLTGGPPAFVAYGHTPEVSPNGKFLAYLTWTALTNAPASIVVMNIATGATTTWSYSTHVPEISELTWAPDSQTLVFTTTVTTGRTAWTYGARSVPLASPNRSLDDARPIRLLAHAFWVGYLNSMQAMEVVVHRDFLDQRDWVQPVVVNVATGRMAKRLPALPGQSESPPNGAGQWQIDPSGHYLALIGQRIRFGVGAGTDLYRWSIDPSPARETDRPRIVKRDVWGPAWVPSS